MTDRELFDSDYYRLLEPFHPEEEARRETAALRERLALSQGDRVLDLGCGWGRHLNLLRDAGHDVVGLDLSLPLLQLAPAASRSSAGSQDVDVSTEPDVPTEPRPAGLVGGDMLRLPFAPASFDVVVNLATSLGLFLDDEAAVTALAEARRVLVPAGRLLLEGMHRDDVVAHFAAEDEWTLADGTRVRARRRFDAVGGVSHEVLRWRGGDGRTRSKRHSLRIRTATEVVSLVERAGLRVTATWGDWDGSAFRHDADRLLVAATSM